MAGFVVKNEHIRIECETLSIAISRAKAHGVNKLYWCNEHLKGGDFTGDIPLANSVQWYESANIRNMRWDEYFDGYEPPLAPDYDLMGW